MFFKIKISSKSKEKLKSFLYFLSKFESNNFNLIIKYFPKQKIKKFITILKSPHVNKSAQEQFEFRIYTKNLTVSSSQNLKFLYFLKKLQNNLFPFINLEIKGHLNTNNHCLLMLNQLEPNQLNIGFFCTYNINLFIQYLNLLDCYGEYYIKNKHL